MVEVLPPFILCIIRAVHPEVVQSSRGAKVTSALSRPEFAFLNTSDSALKQANLCRLTGTPINAGGGPWLEGWQSCCGYLVMAKAFLKATVVHLLFEET